MHVTNDQLLDQFNNGDKKIQNCQFWGNFSHFTSIIWPSELDNFKTNNLFSEKFNNGWKRIQNGRFIPILRQEFYIVAL